jgi:dihydropyrimidinase
MRVDTVFEGGTVVTTEGVTDAAIAVDDGTIVAIGARDVLPAAEESVDVTGNCLLPGVVDPHVHIDDVGGRSGSYTADTAAAALGGVTTLIDFAWNSGPDGTADTLLEWIDHKRAKAGEAHVDFGLHGVLTEDDERALASIPTAVERGVTSFKMFTVYDMGVSMGFMQEAFETIRSHGGVALVHTEDAGVCDRLTDRLREAGRGDPAAYPASRPDYAEAMAAGSAIDLAVVTGVNYYGVHTTSAAALDRFAAHSDDPSVRGETCTHYTRFTEALYDDRGAVSLMSPPLRAVEDRDAIVEGLRTGVLDAVSSDHVVYKEAAKTVDDWWDAPFGVNSVQVGLPVLHDELVVKRGFTLSDLVGLKCTAPAQLFGLPFKGRLAVGADADIVVFDPEVSWTVDPADNRSYADYSIYEGQQVTGRVEATYLRGRRVADAGDVVADPGCGEFLEREPPNWEHV